MTEAQDRENTISEIKLLTKLARGEGKWAAQATKLIARLARRLEALESRVHGIQAPPEAVNYSSPPADAFAPRNPGALADIILGNSPDPLEDPAPPEPDVSLGGVIVTPTTEPL